MFYLILYNILLYSLEENYPKVAIHWAGRTGRIFIEKGRGGEEKTRIKKRNVSSILRLPSGSIPRTQSLVHHTSVLTVQGRGPTRQRQS